MQQSSNKLFKIFLNIKTPTLLCLISKLLEHTLKQLFALLLLATLCKFFAQCLHMLSHLFIYFFLHAFLAFYLNTCLICHRFGCFICILFGPHFSCTNLFCYC